MCVYQLSTHEHALPCRKVRARRLPPHRVVPLLLSLPHLLLPLQQHLLLFLQLLQLLLRSSLLAHQPRHLRTRGQQGRPSTKC